MTSLKSTAKNNDCTFLSTIASILIVEDDVATATVLKTALLGKNFEVTCAYNGQQALDSLKIKRPDLVLLDACLPDINGFAVCEKIRKLHDPDSLPVYMITGLNDSKSIEQAFSRGANDYIAKPYNIQVLCNRLTYMYANKTKSENANNTSEIIYAMRLWNDFVIELDSDAKLMIPNDELPLQLKDLLDEFPTMDDLLKNACKRQSTSQSNAHHDPAFWLLSQGQVKIRYYRFQLIRHMTGKRFLAVADDSENMQEEASLYVDDDTGLPNQAKLDQQLQVSQYNQYDTPNLNIATVQINNYANVRTVMGKEITIKYVKNFVSDLALITYKFDVTAQLFQTQRDTFVLIEKTLSANRFYDLICEWTRPLLKDLAADYLDKVFTYNIGIANKKSDIGNLHALINESNMAAHSERATANQISYFDPAMQTKFAQRVCMVTLLKRDIEKLAMELYFQPKFDAQTLALTGMEALLRWHCDELGSVSPGEFIPVAESTNMMRSLSRLVIEKALAQISLWIDSHALNVPISLNLDATSLSDSGLVDWFIKSVKDLNIPPHLLEVEVTESVMVLVESEALSNIKKLRNTGIRIAMDDFGTGYSSFSYLHSLPLDVLKVDISFVREMECNAKIEAIAKAIIEIGHEFGLHVVAEGVESPSQLKKLADMGCDAVQGFLTGRPSKAIECDDFFSGATVLGHAPT